MPLPGVDRLGRLYQLNGQLKNLNENVTFVSKLEKNKIRTTEESIKRQHTNKRVTKYAYKANNAEFITGASQSFSKLFKRVQTQ